MVAVFVITAIADPNFLSAYNMQNTVKWSSLYGVMSIGVAFVIITGGIDLSIGSVVGLVAVVLSFFTKIQGLDPIVAIGLTLLMSVLIGLIHGLLITKAKEVSESPPSPPGFSAQPKKEPRIGTNKRESILE